MFEEFWKLYPRKVAKLEAKKAWEKMAGESRLKAILMIPLHAKKWTDLQFIPHAATWLRGERYDDEIFDEIQKPKYQTANEKAKEFADRLTGKNRNGNSNDIIDIN